jgi:hypothetical protein
VSRIALDVTTALGGLKTRPHERARARRRPTTTTRRRPRTATTLLRRAAVADAQHEAATATPATQAPPLTARRGPSQPASFRSRPQHPFEEPLGPRPGLLAGSGRRGQPRPRARGRRSCRSPSPPESRAWVRMDGDAPTATPDGIAFPPDRFKSSPAHRIREVQPLTIRRHHARGCGERGVTLDA